MKTQSLTSRIQRTINWLIFILYVIGWGLAKIVAASDGGADLNGFG
jgi:hypothetical protein